MAENLRAQLFNIELKEAQGAKIRSRIQYELEGEKCTKFFFQQIDKRKHAKQDMYSIKRIKDGKVLTNQNDILNEVKNFYTNLYAENPKQDIRRRISTNSPDGVQKITK